LTNWTACVTGSLWRDLSRVIVVVRERRVGDDISHEAHYYISSPQGRRGVVPRRRA